ncbi:hypothetical protein [Pseudarthrobacter sp. NamB4]|uniref:hypothetical protein n=1 Tax=Pseudarthrobacter sp. NamB4 TaxID=2576837 RepID=UPI0010FE13AF|nr:hypothetical protein [Pseudarthrobacter sp. NamB4]TLM73594.1 hypothetical protein FDW81_09115 [Pseudarthrobacter sp. NamB4]
MAVVMYVRADPDASLALMAGFLAFALLFAGLAVLIYRPYFPGPAGGSSAVQASAGHAEQ